jgi:hypothetical protein
MQRGRYRNVRPDMILQETDDVKSYLKEQAVGQQARVSFLSLFGCFRVSFLSLLGCFRVFLAELSLPIALLHAATLLPILYLSVRLVERFAHRHCTEGV